MEASQGSGRSSVVIPLDLQRKSAFRGQTGVDACTKPKTALAHITNRNVLGNASQTIREPARYPEGTGYHGGLGPSRPASYSPCETALWGGLSGWRTKHCHQVPHAEAKLWEDKLDLGQKYGCQLSSRFQPLVPSEAHYRHTLPRSPQNMKYSNQRKARMPLSPRAQRMTQLAQQAEQQKKPLLASLRTPMNLQLERPWPGVAYDIHRIEEWFRLMDNNHSGEITVRKLIIGMMKYQDIMDLVYVLKEKSSGSIWKLKPSERPTAGKLCREDMQWVRGILSELDGDASMTWPEFVDFFRQTGLLLEYQTRRELNESNLGETSLVEHLKKQEEEEERYQQMHFGEERRGARLEQRSSCSMAQTT